MLDDGQSVTTGRGALLVAGRFDELRSSPPAGGLAEMLAGRGAATPDAVALAVAGGAALSFGEWQARSNAAARGLADAGVGAGSTVALLFDGDGWTEFGVAYAAVLKAGATAVPLGRRWASMDLARVLADCSPSLLVSAAPTRPLNGAGSVARVGVAELEAGHDGGPLDGLVAGPVAELRYRPGVLRFAPPTPSSLRDLLAMAAGLGLGDGSVHWPPSPAGRSAAGSVRQPPPPAGRSAVFLHCFPQGVAAASATLLAPLAGWRGVSMMLGRSGRLGGVDPARFAAALAETAAVGAGVGSTMAAALAATAALGDHDLSSLRHLVVSGNPGPTVRAALAAALPQARVALFGETGAATLAPPVTGRGGRPARGPALPSGREPDGVSGREPDGVSGREPKRVSGREPKRVSGREPGWGRAAVWAPVSAAQVGMVWHEQFAPGSFNLSPLVRRYRGRLDVAAMEAALGEIVARHDALRATFAVIDGHARQHLAPPTKFRLPVVDLSGADEADAVAEVASMVAAARRRSLDLAVGPLFAPLLVRLGDEDHVSIIAVHHAVFDDWSVSVFRRELSALYQAFCAGRPSPLPAPAATFAQVCHRKTAAAAEGAARDARFWEATLAGAPVSLELPIGDAGRPFGSALGAAVPVRAELDGRLAAGLRVLARAERATPFMVMLAVLAVVVGRWCDRDDLVISTLVADRDGPDVEAMIGCFAKKVVLRLSLAGDPTFSELVGRARSAVLAALAHKDPAFEAVVQDHLGVVAAAHGLAAQVSVKFQAAVNPGGRLDLPGLDVGPHAAAAPLPPPHFLARDRATSAAAAPPWGAGLYAATFLGLSLLDSDGSMALVGEGVFHPPALRRLLDHVANVAAHATANPAAAISTLAMLGDAEAAQLRRWSTGPAVPVPPDTGIHHLVGALAARRPAALALSGADQLSWADLDDRARRLAARLVAAGVRPGAVVGVGLDVGAAAVTAVLAAWHAGAAYVGLDLAAPPENLAAVVADAAVEVVVADPGPAPALVALRPGLVVVDPAVADRHRALAALAPGGAVSPGEVACVSYRADPAGWPLGVEVSHGGLVNTGVALDRAVNSDGGDGEAPVGLVWLAGRSVADAAFARAVAALGRGYRLHVPRPGRARGAPATLRLLAQGHVDVVEASLVELSRLAAGGLGSALAARAAGRPTATVIVASPDATPAWPTADPAMGCDPADTPIDGVVYLYGPSECAFAATIRPARAGWVGADVGAPVANVTAEVRDRAGRLVPVGVTGDLYLTGAGVAVGYRHRPELSSARFGPGPGPGERRWRSGQRARLRPGGHVELLGDAAGIVDLVGFPVRPARIQAALADCPGVETVAVVAREDQRGRRRLVAYVVAAAGGPAPSLARLRAHLWAKLPGYAWPAALIVVDSLPADPARLDRAGLSAPGVDDPPPTPGAEEAVLAALWADAGGAGRGNYWQSFSFLDALDVAAAHGVELDAASVTRNRSVDALAVDLAAAAAVEAQR